MERELNKDFDLLLHAQTIEDQPQKKRPLPKKRPRWDHGSRKLWFGKTLCLQYKRSAPKQELLLQAFEELNGNESIDDPLPQGTLRDTLKHLQQRLRQSPLVIEADGTGKGVRWKVRDQSASKCRKMPHYPP